MGQTPDLDEPNQCFDEFLVGWRYAYIAGIVDFPGESTILMPCSMLWVFPLLASIFYKDQIKTTSAQNLPQFPQKILVNWSHLSILSHGLSYGFFHGNNASQEWDRLMFGVRELWGPSQVLRKAAVSAWKLQDTRWRRCSIYIYIYICMYIYIYLMVYIYIVL